MKVKAPRGYHFMKKKGGKFSLMKHSGKFKKHKGASLYANYPIKKKHKLPKKVYIVNPMVLVKATRLDL